MRTIFKFNQDRSKLIAYELGDAKIAENAVSRFLDSYGFTGFGRSEEYTSLYDEGWKKLVFGANHEIFLQRRVDKEYLGKFAQSNFGVAGHGCDHYYEDEYRYTYERSLLPKDIMAAFNCMYETIYYSGFIDKVINSNEGRYGGYSVLDEERAILRNAKRNLEEAVAKVSREDFNKKNNDMTWYILESIVVKKIQEYPIRSLDDLVDIFKKYYHPIQYCMSLYGHYGHKFTSLEEFYDSLNISSDNYGDEKYKRYIREFFQSFDLTLEWLDFIKDVEEKKYKKLRMTNH